MLPEPGRFPQANYWRDMKNLARRRARPIVAGIAQPLGSGGGQEKSPAVIAGLFAGVRDNPGRTHNYFDAPAMYSTAAANSASEPL